MGSGAARPVQCVGCWLLCDEGSLACLGGFLSSSSRSSLGSYPGFQVLKRGYCQMQPRPAADLGAKQGNRLTWGTWWSWGSHGSRRSWWAWDSESRRPLWKQKTQATLSPLSWLRGAGTQARLWAGLGLRLLFSLLLNPAHCLSADRKSPALHPAQALCPQTGASWRVLGQSLGRCLVHGNAQSRACLPDVTIPPGAPGSPGRGGKGEWLFPGSICDPVNHLQGL